MENVIGKTTFEPTNDESDDDLFDFTADQTEWRNILYGKSFDEKSFNEKSFDKKSFEEKSFDEKSFEKKSLDEKSFEDKFDDEKDFKKEF